MAALITVANNTKRRFILIPITATPPSCPLGVYFLQQGLYLLLEQGDDLQTLYHAHHNNGHHHRSAIVSVHVNQYMLSYSPTLLTLWSVGKDRLLCAHQTMAPRRKMMMNEYKKLKRPVMSRHNRAGLLVLSSITATAFAFDGAGGVVRVDLLVVDWTYNHA